MSDLTRDKLIEAMARAMFDCYSGYNDETKRKMWMREKWRREIDAARALDAIGALAAVVPREVSEEMLMAAQDAPTAFEAYPAMVAAADLSRPALSEGTTLGNPN